MSQAKSSNIAFIATCAIIIIAQVLVFIYFTNQKQGFHIDEILTFTLANSYNRGFFQLDDGFMNVWHDSGYFLRELTAGEQAFAFGSVYNNQAMDVHPPLYYYAIHVVSSFLPDYFSKWLGVVPNIFFFFFAIAALYRLSYALFKDRWLALLPCVVWGFSAGAIGTVIYIRMYMMLTIFFVLTPYLHYRLLYNETAKEKILLYLSIILCTFLGVMTHYYFLIFAFFISAFYCFYRLLTKEWSSLIQYVFVMFIALGAAVLYFPAAIYHIFESDLGRDAFYALSVGGFYEYFFGFAAVADRELFASFGAFFIILLLLINSSTNKKQVSGKDHYILLFLFLACLMFVAVVANVAPFVINRYIAGIFPLLILCYIKAMHFAFLRITENKRVFCCVILGLFAFTTVTAYRDGFVDNLYPEQRYNTQALYRVGAEHAVYIGGYGYAHSWKVSAAVVDFLTFESIYVTDVYALPYLEDIFAQLGDSDIERAVVYIDTALNQEEAIETILLTTNFTHYERLFDVVQNFSTAFLFERR